MCQTMLSLARSDGYVNSNIDLIRLESLLLSHFPQFMMFDQSGVHEPMLIC